MGQLIFPINFLFFLGSQMYVSDVSAHMINYLVFYIDVRILDICKIHFIKIHTFSTTYKV